MQNLALVHTGDPAFGLTTLGPAAGSLAGQNPIAPGAMLDRACAIFPDVPDALPDHRPRPDRTHGDRGDPRRRHGRLRPRGLDLGHVSPGDARIARVQFERRTGGPDDLGGQLADGLLDVIAFAAGNGALLMEAEWWIELRACLTALVGVYLLWAGLPGWGLGQPRRLVHPGRRRRRRAPDDRGRLAD